jgi:hypothetical protein
VGTRRKTGRFGGRLGDEAVMVDSNEVWSGDGRSGRRDVMGVLDGLRMITAFISGFYRFFVVLVRFQ